MIVEVIDGHGLGRETLKRYPTVVEVTISDDGRLGIDQPKAYRSIGAANYERVIVRRDTTLMRRARESIVSPDHVEYVKRHGWEASLGP